MVLGLSLAGCKIEVIVPKNGKVVTADGKVECATGDSCVFDVSDTDFDQTFIAVPKNGYAFSHWKKAPRHFCTDSRLPCRLFTSAFPGTDFMQFLDSDESFFLEPVFIRFNQAYWIQVLQEIDQGIYTSAEFLYEVMPNIDQCDPGVLTAEAKDRALEALNEVRKLHELGAADYDSSFDAQVAEASLIQAANNYLSHFPDPGDRCYSPSGAAGAETSNLAGGGRQTDPASDIFGWTNDNTNLAALEEAGHRRWNLYPGLAAVSFGKVDAYSALKVFGFNGPPAAVADDLEFVAMPHGVYPYVLVSQGDRPTPWSVSMVPPGDLGSDFDYFADAEVAVSEIRGRKRKALTVHSVHSDSNRFGLGNFLSWMVDDWAYDTEYEVEVSNISLPGGGVGELSYTVLVDRYNLITIDKPLEADDRQQGSTLRGRFDSDIDSDSYTANLSGRTMFSGTSNFSNQGFFIQVFDDRKQLLESSDTAFTLELTGGMYTVVVSPCDETGICYVGVTEYTVNIN